MFLTRDGRREILLATATLGLGGGAAACVAVMVSPWWWALATPLLAAWGLVLAFFRDPVRIIPDRPGTLVSPADGRVTEISRLDHHEGIDGPAWRIGIFLSIFDVHVNRSPCSGRVLAIDYRPGAFLDARHPESGIRNESNTLRIAPADPAAGVVIVRQIAGLIARRVVCRPKVGDLVYRGERIGMLKFGSRTELIVPVSSGLEPAVELNDHVAGGSTILMHRADPADNGAAVPPAEKEARP